MVTSLRIVKQKWLSLSLYTSTSCVHTDNLQIDSNVVTIVGSQCESNYEDGKYCVEVHGHGGRESTCCQRAKQIHEILVLELTPCNDGYFENIALNFGS